MTSIESAPSAAAEAWINGDPDPFTQRELRELVASGDLGELGERMGELQFGTAGLRALLGAGSGRMNRAVVIRTTYGLGRYLLGKAALGTGRPIVIGYDARHQSRQFAEDAAAVLAALGLKVCYFPAPVPTPLVAFAALEGAARAAVVITASHNPAQYNGYKVYADNAIQIIPPADAEIAGLIREAPPARSIARIDTPFSGAHPNCLPLGPEVFERYMDRVDAVRPRTPGDRGLRIVYTPLHGVGGWHLERALRRAGYTDLHPVPEQALPDPDFPTTPFPNPEEPRTLELAQALGRHVAADLVIANDPDADRLCICVPGPDQSFPALSGNQIGLLLADYLLENALPNPPPLVVTTVVSSPMLSAIAEAHGASLERTLTGFKWICNAGIELERRGAGRFVFGYEEAYGYALPVVRDKDGISAAVVFADLAAWCRGRGESVRQYLERLYRRHGLWVSRPLNVVLPGQAGTDRIVTAMERLAVTCPSELAGYRVTACIDYRAGAEHRPRWLPAATVIELQLEGESRLLVRPSGTEPKLKIYVDLRVSLTADQDVASCEAALVPEADAISEHLVRWLGLG